MKQIASIHFDEVVMERPAYGGYYRIPAVDRNAEPAILNIIDKTQIWQTCVSLGKQIRRETITAKEIARDAIRTWTEMVLGASPQCHPGIWIVRDEIPEMYEAKDDAGNVIWKPKVDAEGKQIFRPATEEEKKAMFAEDLAAARLADANYAELLYGQAEEWFTSSNTKDRKFIGDHHKRAAVAYGRQPQWLRSFAQEDMRPCPVCRQMNPGDAMKCKCGEIIDPVAYRNYKNRTKEIMNSTEDGEPIRRGGFHPCSDCGQEFLNPRELVKHRLECTKKGAHAEVHAQPA